MANCYRYGGHRRLPVVSASGAITSGDLVVQEGLVGVALTSVASGAGFWIGCEGVWVLDVPSGTVKGDRLFVAGSPATEDNSAPLTKTSTRNTLAGIAMSDRDSAGKGLVLLVAQGQ